MEIHKNLGNKNGFPFRQPSKGLVTPPQRGTVLFSLSLLPRRHDGCLLVNVIKRMTLIFMHRSARIRANAPEISTRIPFFIVMKSDNYPHAKRVRRPKGLKAISQISQKARRFARACRLCRRREMSVGCDEGNFSFPEECSLLHIAAGRHTQAIACVICEICEICEIREIRVKINHLCVKILVRLPCARMLPSGNSCLALPPPGKAPYTPWQRDSPRTISAKGIRTDSVGIMCCDERWYLS